MKLNGAIDLFANEGSGYINPPGTVTDTPAVRDIARRRLVKTNPDVDANKDSQTDSAGFIGKKYVTQDTKYGHYIDESSDKNEAFNKSLARPYTRIITKPEIGQTDKSRNLARKKVVQENPDIFASMPPDSYEGNTIQEQLKDMMEMRSFYKETSGKGWIIYSRGDNSNRKDGWKDGRWCKVYFKGNDIGKVICHTDERPVYTSTGWQGACNFAGAYGD